jgi:DNA uptake protein ComE-like DNA-binding protein
MYWIRRWVKDFFFLSHSQANGFIILVPLLGIVIFSGPLWHWYISTRTEDRTKDLAMLDSLVALWEVRSSPAVIVSSDSLPAEFHFDPNQATLQELEALGFQAKVAVRIDRYRQKGGRFFAKKDLLKIYGIDSSLYMRLYAFIDLPETSGVKRTHDKKAFSDRKKIPAHNAPSKFDINKADTSQLMSVAGIGSKRSQRIMKYRDALGGFISMDQLQEVFGLDSVVVRKVLDATFIASDFQPVTINVNTSDEKRLAFHPYLSNAAARSIVAYRFQHGDFKAMEELRNIHALDEKTIQKITPYLTLGD